MNVIAHQNKVHSQRSDPLVCSSGGSDCEFRLPPVKTLLKRPKCSHGLKKPHGLLRSVFYTNGIRINLCDKMYSLLFVIISHLPALISTLTLRCPEFIFCALNVNLHNKAN